MLKKSDKNEGAEEVGEIETLIQRCQFLKNEEKSEEYISTGTLIQYSHCYPIHTEEESLAIVGNRTTEKRIEALREIKEESFRQFPEFVNKNIPPEELWHIFKTVSNMLMEQKRFEELQKISLSCLSSVLFTNIPEYSKDLEFQALLSCFYNGSHLLSYILVQDLILKYKHCNKAWNLFCLIVTIIKENSYGMFFLRLRMENQDHWAFSFFIGHSDMISENLTDALGEYLDILETRPDDICILLCTGMIFIDLACINEQDSYVKQGMAYLERYKELRGECQETLYNLGRALHQLGLSSFLTTYQALRYYKSALQAPIAISGPEEHMYDLTNTIAFNISLIYQGLGAMDLARKYSRLIVV